MGSAKAVALVFVSAVLAQAQHRDRWADIGLLSLGAVWAEQLPPTREGLAADRQGGAVPPAAPLPPSARVTASRLPLSILRAVTGHTPEGMSLYAGRVCSLSADAQMIDAGTIEQAIEARGIAVSTRPLAQIAVQRSRSKALSVLARFGEAASWVAPVVLGLAASGNIHLTNGWIATVGGAGSALKMLSERTAPERAGVTASIGDLGLWLSDMPTLALAKGQCSPRFLFAGSYDQKVQTVTIDLEGGR